MVLQGALVWLQFDLERLEPCEGRGSWVGVGGTSTNRAMLIESVTNKGGVRPDLMARGGWGLMCRLGPTRWGGWTCLEVVCLAVPGLTILERS